MPLTVDPIRLRGRISEDQFDYQSLLHSLREYAQPRNRITSLLRSGHILRVKKGLYVFGERLRKRTISRELLSNLIYGPSYVSMEFALQRHGLIPEEVPVVSAVTIRRSRWFNTPLGMFTYSSIPVEAYPAGITLNRSDHTSFFIATPEKALADLVHHRRGLSLRSTHDVESFLEEDLRIESESIRDLNPAVLREILGRPSSVKVKYFITTLLRHYLEAHHA